MMNFEPSDFRSSSENLSLGVSPKIHIQVQQRNARKRITVISEIPRDLDLRKITEFLKKKLHVGGSANFENHVIQLAGDTARDAEAYLVAYKVCEPGDIYRHG